MSKSILEISFVSVSKGLKLGENCFPNINLNFNLYPSSFDLKILLFLSSFTSRLFQMLLVCPVRLIYAISSNFSNLILQFISFFFFLQNLQYLCKDCDSLQLVTDIKKHLDAVLASAINLSSSAEAYGYVQNEEKVSGAVFVMLQHLENVERVKSEKPDRLKSDSKR